MGTPSDTPVLLWFRRDLRLADNPAFAAAAAAGPVLPVFVLEDGLGGASRWWLHQALESLATDLAERGLPLILGRGDPVRRLPDLARETGARSVHWSRRYEPEAAAVDRTVTAALTDGGVAVHSHPGALLLEPEDLKTGQGGPYQVFTPYYRKFLDTAVDFTEVDPPRASPPTNIPDSLPLAGLDLLPKVDWASGFHSAWLPGEAGARQALDRFLTDGLTRYDTDRDRPAIEGTARLSAHLHWGEISPRAVWRKASGAGEASAPFLRQLVWREFTHHLLHHFPHTVDQPLRQQFAHFPWDGDPALLPAWQRGETGYPLVDAGMRQLWQSGWMHNRVRMVVASFLVKHLLLPWTDGAHWFADTLVDADLANNTFGWQWVAGSGADGAPYFRIFNPMTQSRKFDPRGAYIRRWVPELAGLPDKHLHAPWEAPPAVLEEAGVRLGSTYPNPVVDHADARARALASYRRMTGGPT